MSPSLKIGRKSKDVTNYDRSDLEKSSNERRSKLVEARDKHMTRVLTEESKDIFPRFTGTDGQKGITEAFQAAFQSHAIRSTPRFSYAGAPKAKKTSRKTISGKQKTVFNTAFQSFHSNIKYVAPFRNALTEDEAIEKAVQQEYDKEVVSFIKRLQSNTGTGQNQIHLVTGEIGCGKSTLLSNVVFKITKLQADQEEERKRGALPIECALVDFDKIPLPGKDHLGKFESYMEDVVGRAIATQISAETNLSGNDLLTIASQATGKHLVLVFDSMDAAYHRFCTGLFVHGDELDEVASLNIYFPMVFRVIEAFGHGDFSGLGITCVFALRTDTLDAFEKSPGPEHGGAKLINSVKDVFTIREPDAHYLKEIIERRLLLAKDCADSSKAKLFDKRITQIRNSKVEYANLIDVSVHGLRHIVSVLARISHCIENDSLFERLFCQEPSLRLFFYASGKEHYSQVNEGVTNIFLVNNRYRVANNPQSVSGEKLFAEKKLADHAHTYWLKYFILQLIHTVGTDHSTILKLFSKIGTYNSEIVDLVLFSLSEVKHGRLIRPNVSFSNDGKVNSTGLEVTTRGERLLEKKCFWDFFYLSMIVEDTWLEFPNEYAEVFKNPIGFKFIGSETDSEYEENFTNFLIEKIEVVFLFLHILEVFLKFEMKENISLFETLRDKGVEFPNFGKIRRSCADQVTNAASAMSVAHKMRIDIALRKNTSVIKRHFAKRKIIKSAKHIFN